MTSIWHLVKKDLRRLGIPVAVLSLLTIGKIIFYAAIAGLFRPPDLEWLQRLQSGPELLLRALAEPLITYFLVGWLVFEDSPVEKDAHWLTRPISGLKLFAAKLAGAGLMFVLLPLVLNIPWWMACGLSGNEIAISAVELVVINSSVVAVGLMCASLTDGFPRFILWSLVALGSFAMVQMILVFLGNPGPGLFLSRLTVWIVSGSLFALAIAGYQFATRRHRRSLALAVAGIILAGGLGSAWRWNLTNLGRPRLETYDGDAQGMRFEIVGPAHYHHVGEKSFVQLALRIADLPPSALVTQIRATGEWSIQEAKVWTSRVKTTDPAMAKEAICRVLGFKASAQTGNQIVLSLPFSPQIERRTKHEQTAFHASVDLDLFRGRIMGEFPVREEAAPGGRRAFTISNITNSQLKKNRLEIAAAPQSAPMQNAVGIVLTERSADGLMVNAMARPSPTYYALVNRGTGDVFLSDPARTGPMAITTINQTRVTCRQLTFLVEAASVRREELVLVVIRFGDGGLIERYLDLDPMPFAESQPQGASIVN